MNYKRTFLSAFMLAASRSPDAAALAPPAAPARPHPSRVGIDTTRLGYADYPQAARGRRRRDGTDVEGRRVAVRPLRTLQDYSRHVLDEPDQLSILRFAGPSRACRATNDAWEGVASAIRDRRGRDGDDARGEKRIRFFSVLLGGEGEEEADDVASSSLRDMLQVKRVPQGVVHHPTQGLFGQKIELNRSNLSRLRGRLEKYLEVDGMESRMALEDVLYPAYNAPCDG